MEVAGAVTMSAALKEVIELVTVLIELTLLAESEAWRMRIWWLP